MSRVTNIDDLPDVDIDSNGRFKYILIKVIDDDKSKFLVRGYKWAAYHADIFDVVAPQDSKFKYECVGGGRIQHSSEKKTIHVYGYSQGFGQADHKISCDLISKKYPDYKVTWSNEGY
ncbi:14 kDa phosphohistidine phosphatase-like [Dermatophagoides pteronyssinus]|uniref:14 kDa phosphohistidine phosphatase n=2 Tax=Dermatophagoides pteronyssinus TaxID=6956 RepID=A0ABQ8IZR1_DERPT|nr:14 kDa phosphohistidine phosphatase-like [Dermatophagoides pteronyssinus]KAH9415722.1 14 kDa phosphohistidine phosphatase [Dermatophagoides pteronyssinus]